MTSPAKPKKTAAAADPPAQLPVVIDDGVKIAPVDLCAGAQASPDRKSLGHDVAANNVKPTAVGYPVNPAMPTAKDDGVSPVPVIAGAHLSADDKVDFYVNLIRKEWRKSTQGIMKVARLCAEAHRSLDPHRRFTFENRLRSEFDRTTLSKFVSIGKNDALYDEHVQKHLPPNWTLIVPLRNCTKEELYGAIDDGVLNRKASRQEIIGWVSEHSSHRKEQKSRTAQNDAYHDDLLRDLRQTFLNSPEIMAIWKRCPNSIRKRFGRDLGNWT